ncbi:hypothetical protein Dimus_020609 [Dionaea muscipula]
MHGFYDGSCYSYNNQIYAETTPEAQKFPLEQEIKELKIENDSMIEISSQMKADVEMMI